MENKKINENKPTLKKGVNSHTDNTCNPYQETETRVHKNIPVERHIFKTRLSIGITLPKEFTIKKTKRQTKTSNTIFRCYSRHTPLRVTEVVYTPPPPNSPNKTRGHDI